MSPEIPSWLGEEDEQARLKRVLALCGWEEEDQKPLLRQLLATGPELVGLISDEGESILSAWLEINAKEADETLQPPVGHAWPQKGQALKDDQLPQDMRGKIFGYLLWLGADPFAKTPFQVGSDTYDCVAECLLHQGLTSWLDACLSLPNAPSVDVFNKNAHWAKAVGDPDLSGDHIRALLAMGFPLNEQDAEGKSLLFHARAGETVQVLLEAGLGHAIVSNNGDTVVDYWKKELSTYSKPVYVALQKSLENHLERTGKLKDNVQLRGEIYIRNIHEGRFEENELLDPNVLGATWNGAIDGLQRAWTALHASEWGSIQANNIRGSKPVYSKMLRAFPGETAWPAVLSWLEQGGRPSKDSSARLRVMLNSNDGILRAGNELKELFGGSLTYDARGQLRSFAEHLSGLLQNRPHGYEAMAKLVGEAASGRGMGQPRSFSSWLKKTCSASLPAEKMSAEERQGILNVLCVFLGKSNRKILETVGEDAVFTGIARLLAVGASIAQACEGAGKRPWKRLSSAQHGAILEDHYLREVTAGPVAADKPRGMRL